MPKITPYTLVYAETDECGVTQLEAVQVSSVEEAADILLASGVYPLRARMFSGEPLWDPMLGSDGCALSKAFYAQRDAMKADEERREYERLKKKFEPDPLEVLHDAMDGWA